MRRSIFGGTLAVCFGLCIVPAGQAAEPAAATTSAAGNGTPAENPAQLARRLESVETMIEKSSVAKQIETSANPDAQARREQARELRRQAAQAYAAQDYGKSNRLLDEAAKALFEGVRLAAPPEQVMQQKKRRDFESRLESVKVLLAAQKRIGSEKHLDVKEGEISRKIEALIQQANALAAANKLDEARAALDQAYVVNKTAISGLRSGDTLVRSLHFATKEEEYRYEIDRNDTHKMLIQVLLAEKRGTPGIDAMVQKFLEQAAQLRATAEQLAAKGDYEGGVKMLENSTSELVRAIRSAGIYIPG